MGGGAIGRKMADDGEHSRCVGGEREGYDHCVRVVGGGVVGHGGHENVD